MNDIFLARLNKDFSNAIKDKNEDELNAFLKNMAAYNLPADEETLNNYRLIFYQQTGDWKKMMTQLDEYIKIHGETDISLNEYCWAIYENCDDEVIVKRATGIMAKVTAANPMYAEMDTYAALLYKSKQYYEAETVAVNAIAKGKSENSDVSGTEVLLEKIKAAKQR